MTTTYVAKRDKNDDRMAAYDSQIPYLDFYLDRFFDGLNWKDAFVVLISDHGEEFKEHGNYLHLQGLHQELNRILFSIRAPSLVPRRIRQNVSLIDLLPTILELVGIEPPETAAGWSLVSLLKGDDSSTKARFADRVLFAHRTKTIKAASKVWWSALQGQWKLIDGPSGRSLYNHTEDFYEQDNLIASEPLRAELLGQALDNFQRQPIYDNGERATFVLDAEMLEELRALGYIE